MATQCLPRWCLLTLPWALASCLLLVATPAPSLALHLQPWQAADISTGTAAGRSDVTPDSYIVELEGDPAILGGSSGALAAAKSQLAARLARKGIRHRVRRSFSTLINGVVLELSDPARISTVASLPGVKAVYPNSLLSIPQPATTPHASAVTDQPPLVDLKPEHNMTGVNEVHRVLGITGRGVRIGIIDSGVDYTHPAFGACAKVGTGCRVAYGYDFVGDEYDAGSSNASKRIAVPDGDPQDCYGHGTHVAGIAAAKDSKLWGVAPGATLGAYRVFGCAFTTAQSVVLAALARAYHDGMDVINLSLDRYGVWAEADPISLAIDRLASKGVLVFVSTGNAGQLGLWQSGLPGLAAGAVAVAAFENTAYPYPALLATSAGEANTSVPYSAPAGNSRYTGGVLVASSNDTSVEDDGCSSYGNTTKFAGKIALIRSGTCSSLVQALHAQGAGASGVLIYNQPPGPDDGGEYLDPPGVNASVTVPVAAIPASSGEALVAQAQAQTVLVSFPEGAYALFANPDGGQVSLASSWGPGPDLAVKPDIGAPGVEILSTEPLANGGDGVRGGTSMASPYVAAVAALYLSVNRKLQKKGKVAAVKQILQNSAVPASYPGGAQVPTLLQGAGLVNALQALRGNSTVTPAVLNLGFVPQIPSTLVKRLQIRNRGGVLMTYNISNVAAYSATGAVTPSPADNLEDSTASVSFSSDDITIPPGATLSVDVTLTFDQTPPDSDFRIHSGYIAVQPLSPVSPSYDYSTVYVPYQAIVGDPQSFQILPTGSSAPDVQSLATYGTGPTFSEPNETVTFTFNSTSQDVPVFRLRVLRPARTITFQLYNFRTNKFVGYAGYWQYYGATSTSTRDSTTAYYRTQVWDAPSYLPAVRRDPLRQPSTWTVVPDGSYYVIISAVKALGGSFPRALTTETWRSPKLVFQSVS